MFRFLNYLQPNNKTIVLYYQSRYFTYTSHITKHIKQNSGVQSSGQSTNVQHVICTTPNIILYQ